MGDLTVYLYSDAIVGHIVTIYGTVCRPSLILYIFTAYLRPLKIVSRRVQCWHGVCMYIGKRNLARVGLVLTGD